MKSPLKTLVGVLALSFGVLPLTAFAVSRPAGDFIGVGASRGGMELPNDSTVFEGDSVKTNASSGGILRLGRGRVEIGESSEVVVERLDPLWIVVKFGTVNYSFPEGTDVTILTPVVKIRPERSSGRITGRILAEQAPAREDRVHTDRIENYKGRVTVVSRLTRDVDSTLEPMMEMTATFEPQGPMQGTRIARLEMIEGQVYAARARTPKNYVALTASQIPLNLADGDLVKTVKGKGRIKFDSDTSIITMNLGTEVKIAERRPPAGGVTRTVTQYIGSLWFNITKGSDTKFETPTAVAAIRGTEGAIDSPNPSQSTFMLNDGVQDITERVTGATVTLNQLQIVTAIRGVGFGQIFSILAAVTQPIVGGTIGSAAGNVNVGGGGAAGGGGGAAGGGGGAAGGGGGAAGGGGGATGGGATGGGATGGATGGGAAGGASSAATNTASSAVATSVTGAASTLSSVATVSLTTGFSALATTALVPISVRENVPASGSRPPLSFPGA